MSMEKKAGKQLQTGVSATGISGVHEQSATKSQVGELKTYKDKDGNEISVYVTGRHVEYSFEAILESSVDDKEVGATIQISGISGTCVVTKWDVVESNEDVKKVSIGVRTFPDISE